MESKPGASGCRILNTGRSVVGLAVGLCDSKKHPKVDVARDRRSHRRGGQDSDQVPWEREVLGIREFSPHDCVEREGRMQNSEMEDKALAPALESRPSSCPESRLLPPGRVCRLLGRPPEHGCTLACALPHVARPSCRCHSHSAVGQWLVGRLMQ